MGAVAVTQCDATAHDVVAEPSQGASIHTVIMTDKSGNVASLCSFRSIRRTKQRKLFPRDSGQVGPDLVDGVPEQFLDLLPGQAHHLHLGAPASSRRTTLASGVAASTKPVWERREGNWRILMASLAFSNHYDAYHCGNRSGLRILASNFRPLLSQRTTLRQGTLVTEPHVGYSKDQIAQAVLDTELATTPANAVVIDAVARFRPQSDQRGQDGEMHDVFIVTSEGSGGGHIVRTIHAASEDDARQTTGKTSRRAHRGGSPIDHPGSSHSRRRVTPSRSGVRGATWSVTGWTAGPRTPRQPIRSGYGPNSPTTTPPSSCPSPTTRSANQPRTRRRNRMKIKIKATLVGGAGAAAIAATVGWRALRTPTS